MSRRLFKTLSALSPLLLFVLWGTGATLLWWLTERPEPHSKDARWAPQRWELPFTKEAWAAADEETRGRMHRDLLRKHPLVGMTQEEVLELLGDTENKTTVEEMDRRRQERGEANAVKEPGTGVPGRLYSLTYHIGHLNGRGMMRFSYMLHIRFEEGRVVDAYVDD